MPLNYKQVCKRLKKTGFEFYRDARGSHELWKNEHTGKTILLSNHGKLDIPNGTLQQIAKSAGFRNLRDFQNYKG